MKKITVFGIYFAPLVLTMIGTVVLQLAGVISIAKFFDDMRYPVVRDVLMRDPAIWALGVGALGGYVVLSIYLRRINRRTRGFSVGNERV